MEEPSKEVSVVGEENADDENDADDAKKCKVVA